MFNFKNIGFWLMIIILSLLSSISICLGYVTLPTVAVFFVIMVTGLDIADIITDKIRKNFVKSL